MTSLSPGRRVRCNSEHPDQASGPCQHIPTTVHTLSNFKQGENNPPSKFRCNAGRNFENRLLRNEHRARDQYLRLLNALSLEKLPGWFNQMLDQRIFPTLNRIGFDQTISKGLFQIASCSWSRLGPATDKVIAFHPKIDQEIEEIRRGLEQTASRLNDTISRLPGSSSAVFSGTINESPSPEHLFALLHNIATPWIVLPRASRFLEKDQCRYLQAYLNAIAQEKRESFLILFTRITVEFVGNYAYKFAAKSHRPDQIAKLLFYAYACLFWKTLRCPPRNLESSAVFDIFLNWLKRLAAKSDNLGDAAHRSIKGMQTVKKLVFPAAAGNQPGKLDTANSSRFLVTLRHGCPGIAAVLKYFGIDQFLKTGQRASRFQCRSFDSALQEFLYTIQTGYHLESRQTRDYIQRFMACLQSSLELAETDCIRTDRKFLMKKLNNIQVLLNK